VKSLQSRPAQISLTNMTTAVTCSLNTSTPQYTPSQRPV